MSLWATTKEKLKSNPELIPSQSYPTTHANRLAALNGLIAFLLHPTVDERPSIRQIAQLTAAHSLAMSIEFDMPHGRPFGSMIRTLSDIAEDSYWAFLIDLEVYLLDYLVLTM